MRADRRQPEEPASQTAHQAGASADAVCTFDAAYDALAADFPGDRASDEPIDGKQAVGVNHLADGLGRSELGTTKRILDELGGTLQGDGAEHNGKGRER